MKSQRLLFVTAWLIWIIFLSACAPSQSAAPTLTPSPSPTAFPTPDLKPASTFVVGESKIPEGRFLFVEYGEAKHVADVPGNKCESPRVHFDNFRKYWFEDEKLEIDLDEVTPEVDACWIASCTTADGKLVVDRKSVSTRTLGFMGCESSTSVFASGGTTELLPIRGLPFVPCSSGMKVLSVDEQGAIVVEIMGIAYLMEPDQSWTYSIGKEVAPGCWQITDHVLTNFGLLDKDHIEIRCQSGCL